MKRVSGRWKPRKLCRVPRAPVGRFNLRHLCLGASLTSEMGQRNEGEPDDLARAVMECAACIGLYRAQPQKGARSRPWPMVIHHGFSEADRGLQI